MINGIRLVTDRDRVSTRVYRKLHSLLKNNGVPYCKPKQQNAFDDAIEKVSNLAKLKIYHKMFNYRGRKHDVENELRSLQFNRCVAVCDIFNGAHSILLHNRTDDWFDGFDPWWYGEERCGNSLLKFPKGNSTVNVKIHQRHLFAKDVDERKYKMGMEYHMGANYKFLTVICRQA